jgi:glutathione S-transferase
MSRLRLLTLDHSGIPPNEEGMPYTLPAIRLNGTFYQDSGRIAAHIEQLYPSPPLHLQSPVLSKVEALMPKLMFPLRSVIMPRIPRTILNERSAEYFHETRAKRFGMPLDELEKSEYGGDKAWENVKPVCEEVARLLKETEGPFFMGKEGKCSHRVFGCPLSVKLYKECFRATLPNLILYGVHHLILLGTRKCRLIPAISSFLCRLRSRGILAILQMCWSGHLGTHHGQ